MTEEIKCKFMIIIDGEIKEKGEGTAKVIIEEEAEHWLRTVTQEE